MEKILATVIIPHYNLPENLAEAIESVLNQSFKDFELLIVDLGSDNKQALEILKKYSSNERCRVITEKIKWNLPEARNIGIKEAKGKYITCLDADDKFDKDYLKSTIEVLENDKTEKIGFVTTYVELFDQETGVWKFEDPSIPKLLTESPAHVASLFRKKAWDAVKGYDKTLSGYQDWNFWIAIVEQGYTWEIVEKPLFHYRRRANSMLTESIKKDEELYRGIMKRRKKIFDEKFEEIIIYQKNTISKLGKEKQHLDIVLQQYEKDLRKARREKEILTFQNNSLEDIKKQYEDIQRSIIWQTRNLVRGGNLSIKQRLKLFAKIIFRFIPFGNKLKDLLRKFIQLKKVTVENEIFDGPLVSVIIPLYNYGQYIDDAVNSALDQGLGDRIEIIIVEGFSNDGTRELVKTKNWANTRVIFQDHRASIGENRLLGIQEAKGKYVCCLDADDKLGKGYLKMGIEILEKTHGDVGYTDTKQFDEDNKEFIAPAMFNLENLFHWNTISTISIFRKSFWSDNNVGYSNDRETFEDWDFWMRMASKGARFIRIPGFFHLYRVHTSESESMTDLRLEKQKEREDMTKENFNTFLGSDEHKFAADRMNTHYQVNNPFINTPWKKK